MNKFFFFILAITFFFLNIPGCGPQDEVADKIVVPPPSGSSRGNEGEQTYEYEHQLETRPAEEKKPVVALLRTGDLIQLDDVLPFGRQMVISSPEEKGESLVIIGPGEVEDMLPRDVREHLTRELVNSRKLIVVDRERIIEIVREQKAGQSEVFEPVTAPRKGRLFGVHYILEGTFFRPGTSAAVETVSAMPRYSQAQDVNRMAVLIIKAYDVDTGQIIANIVGANENSALATREAVRRLLLKFKLDKNIRVVSFDSNGNPILDRGSASGIKVGDRFTTISLNNGKKVELEVWKVDPLSCVVKMLTGQAGDLQVGDVAIHHLVGPQG